MSDVARSMEIPDRMRAVVCHGPGDYRIEEVAVPEVGPNEVLLKVQSCGICASDVKCWKGAALFWGDKYRPRYVEPPVVGGHEFVGDVVALGEGAAEKHGVQLGDMAVAEQIVPCWDCYYCNKGLYWLCVKAQVYGFKQMCGGGFAPFMKLPAGACIVYKVPKTMTHNQAAFIEPLGCAIHAVERGEIKLGDVAVIAGNGPLGLSMVGAARLKNPGMLIAIDPLETRRNMAKRMGADLVINPDEEDAVETVRKLTGGIGCDVFIEATGHPEAVGMGLHMIRKMGTFVEFSVLVEDVTADWTIIGDGKELNIHGAHLAPYSFPVAIDYIERGLIDVEPLVTHEVPLSEFNDGINTAANPTDSIKIVVRPEG